jgi:DNA sulfur modification protein DndE
MMPRFSHKRIFISLIILLITTTSWKSNSDNEKPTLFLCGDSTMADKAPIDAPETGWGMMFGQYFTDAIKIENHAVNGRSTRSFRNLGHWQKVSSKLKKGDWVMLQFGHNDAKVSDTSRYASPEDYQKNLLRYIEEIEAKGASPVLITPVMRRKFDESGKMVPQHGDYIKVVKEMGKRYHVPVLDLYTKSYKIIESQGVESSKILFMHYGGGIFQKFPKGITDDTHFSKYGADIMACAVVETIFDENLPLKYVIKKSEFDEKYQYELPHFYTPVFKKDTFDITRYGAKSDGITPNTKAINQAIEQCNQAGGGTVLIPKGLWLTGSIVMLSNVNLYIKKGAILQFSRNPEDYPTIITTWEGEEAYRCQAPISGKNLENIALTGEGIIDGGGDVWRAIKKSKQTTSEWERLVKSGGVLNESKDTWFPSEKSLKGSLLPKAGKIIRDISGNITSPSTEELMNYKDFLRPNMVSFTGCQYILIEGLSFQNSPAWTLHPLLCKHISVKNVKVKNFWYAQNSDAIDLESCQNGILENCTFDTGDDGITIKSGRDEQGRKRGVPTENFIIRNNTVYHAHGGFVIGSEMSGGVRNLFVSNCNFSGTDVGLRFKTTRGRGGIVEKIYVNDIQMTDIAGEAILFDMYYAAKDPVPLKGDSNEPPVIEAKELNETTPIFREFYVRNVNCFGAETGIMMRGLPEMNVKNIVLENINIQSNKGLSCIESTDIQMINVQLLTKDKSIGLIQNCQNIKIEGLKFRKDITEKPIQIYGNRNKNIKER